VQADARNHAAQMPLVDRSAGAWNPEPLRRECDAPGFGKAQRFGQRASAWSGFIVRP